MGPGVRVGGTASRGQFVGFHANVRWEELR